MGGRETEQDPYLGWSSQSPPKTEDRRPHGRDALGPLATLAAVLVGGAITYYASRQLQVSQGRDAARGAARVLQEDYRDRLAGVNVFADDRDHARAFLRDMRRVESAPVSLSSADRKLIASNLDADDWQRIVEATVFYERFRSVLSEQRQRLVRHESVDMDAVWYQAVSAGGAIGEGIYGLRELVSD
jgi:hypothetical protein